VDIPKTRYARSADGTYIAYQVFGGGEVDLLWISPWFSELEMMWEYQPAAQFHRAMASFARVIMLDQRGVGLSDRTRGFPDLETRMDDLRAVLDAAGSDRTVLWGAGPDGGALCGMYAATYPDRVASLAFWNASPKATSGLDYPWGLSQDEVDAFERLIAEGWGSEDRAAEIMEAAGVESLANDPEAVRWFARTSRRMGAPGDVLAFDKMWNEIDFRAVLPNIHVPTLAIFKEEPDIPTGTEDYEYLVSLIPGAHAVRVPAGDFPPWPSNTEAAVGALREFINETSAQEADFDRVLATVLFTDMVDSTSNAVALGDRAWRPLVEKHHATVRALLTRFRGLEVDTAGDGFFATFDGPARAVRCAQAIVEAVRRLGLEIRAGVHTGEVQMIARKAGGLGVVIGARVGALAAASEVLATSTVKDLTAGSGLLFEDVGEHELKGVPDPWRLYRVVNEGESDSTGA
jgi:class 3 adenylate cyclase